jgi:hypothetical protein
MALHHYKRAAAAAVDAGSSNKQFSSKVPTVVATNMLLDSQQSQHPVEFCPDSNHFHSLFLAVVEVLQLAQ